MFKKKFNVSGENQLSGKDKKILKNSLTKIIAAEVAAQFIDKSDKIISKKVQSSKMIIFVECDNPMIVDLSGSG